MEQLLVLGAVWLLITIYIENNQCIKGLIEINTPEETSQFSHLLKKLIMHYFVSLYTFKSGCF